MDGPLIQELDPVSGEPLLADDDAEPVIAAKKKSKEGKDGLKKRKAKKEGGVAPTSGGIRLGGLMGLDGEGDKRRSGGGGCCDRDEELDPNRKKEGVKLLPLILLFVVFGPVVMTALVFITDRASCMDVVINTGLVTHPRDYMKEFYTKWDRSKLPKIEGFVNKYKGNYCTLYKKLEGQEYKYKIIKETRRQRAEEEKYYGEDNGSF